MSILQKKSSASEPAFPLKAIGWTSIALGVATLGLVVGRELRLRYKFKRRTPYDFYAHSGDQTPSTEYGVGI